MFLRAAIVAALLLALGCTSAPPAPPGSIVVGMTNSALDMDPRVAGDEASQKVHQLVYSSLVQIDDKLRIVPDVAESLEQPDSLTYVARLRKGVLFHNGRELTSADVVYTFRSLIDPDFRGRTGAYRLLGAVDAIDSHTVKFTLKEPFASFPINLVMGIVQDGSGVGPARMPIGTGPYKLTSFAADDRIVLSPFPEHYKGAPKNNGILLKVVPDDTMRGLELRKGTVDIVVNDVAPDIVAQLRNEGHLKLVTAPGTDYAYMGMNLRDPILSRVEVRKAIGFAIDRGAIVQHLRRGLATPAVGIVPPMSWAFASDVFEFRHDPAEARRLLDQAGYPDPDGDGPRPRFALTIKTSTSEVYRTQAAVIQHDLAQVGIHLDVRSSELPTLLSDAARGNFQLYTLQFVGVTDPDMLRRVYHSRQAPPAGLNRVFYVNPQVDGLIEQAALPGDDDERRALYVRAQQLIADDVPYIPLWYRINVAVSQADIHGVTLSPIADFAFLKDVYREPTR
ncbi:MAG: ABC transporter substrate-binding protein [Acidobacteria bacterium]|nr:ABC transporter substrate-binding protein [Acidobacteriota bacterium]